MRAKTAFFGKNYYCFFVSLPDGLAGAVGEALEDGALLEPLAALPLDAGGVPEALELDEPPEAGALGDAELEELLSLSLSVLLMSADAEPEVEPEAEPEGAGVVAEPDGAVLEPADEDEPGVVLETVRSPSLSHPVSNPAPSARDTATARVESFM